MRDAFGDYIVQHAEPTRLMVTAAKDALDRVGVVPDAQPLRLELDARKVLNQTVHPVTVSYPEGTVTEEQKAMSRERRRNLMGMLAPVIVQAKQDEKKAGVIGKNKSRKK